MTQLFEEPPAGTELHLTGRDAVHEVACHGGEQVVLRRVQIVNDHFGQGLHLAEAAQVAGKRFALVPVADRIAADVRPQ